MVYSTDPDYLYEHEENIEAISLSPSEQLLYISLDRKGRKGKVITLINGFRGTQNDLKKLEKKLKSLCGTGGTSKNGDILIQGDFRDRIIEVLKNEGFKVKRKGG